MDATSKSPVGAGVDRDGGSHLATGLAGVEPRLHPNPVGGQVVVTRFECPNLLSMAILMLLHRRVRRDVRRRATGFVGVKMLVNWSRRVLLSVSMWEDLESVYSMGRVGLHITATRLPGRLGVRTASGIFCYMGDWRHVMFGSSVTTGSPLKPLEIADTQSKRTKEDRHADSN
jgi:hypothetical protein